MKFFKNNISMQQSDAHQSRRFTLGQYITAVFALLLSVTALSYATGLLTMIQFSNGTAISSADVNTNFQRIHDRLEAMTAPGSVVQMQSVQSRVQASYSAPIVVAPIIGNGTQITPLNIVITPRKAGNAMVLEWHVNGEAHQDTVYIVQRNGLLLLDTTDVSNLRYAGLAAQPYDGDSVTTPDNAILRITDFNTLAIATTYSLHIRASGGTAYTLFLNRPVGSAGVDTQETSLSSATATEIAQ